MRVALDWGHAQRANLPDDWDIPTADVPNWLTFVWRAWWRLHPDRPWHGGGMGGLIPGRIPWRDIRTWAEFHDLSGAQYALLDKGCQAMDEVYCDWHARKAKEQAAMSDYKKGLINGRASATG